MNAVSDTFNESKLSKTCRTLTNPMALYAFQTAKMPLGTFAGLRCSKMERGVAEVTLPGGWRTQNPFGVMYWAAQGMAAEMATGLLGYALCQAAPVPVRMILKDCAGEFTRMCKGRARFVFEDGDKIEAAIRSTLASGETENISVKVRGFDRAGEQVSEWTFTWSFRARLKK